MELDGLRSELESTGENHSLATNQLIAALKERENALNKLKEDHEASKTSYESRIADAQRLQQELEQKTSKLTTDLAKARTEWEQSDQQLQETATGFEATKKEHRNEIGQFQQQLEEARSQASESRDQLEQTQRERDALEKTVFKSERELTVCRSNIDTLREKLTIIETHLEQSRQDSAQSDQKLLLVTKEREEAEKGLREELDTVQTALGDAHSQISELKSQLVDARKEGATLLANQSAADELQAVQEKMRVTEEKYEAEMKQLRDQVQESENRLDRQLGAFNTIRGELTTVRERQLDREDEIEQKMQIKIDDLEQDLEEAFEKRKLAEDKLAQNGLSPVSERGFWVSDDGQTDSDLSDGEEELSSNNEKAIHQHRSPMLGRVPPLQKPRFSEFHHVPQCNGCISEAFDI